MNIDFRRNLQQAGTIFVGVVQKSADSAMAFSKGAATKYGITSLSSKKEKIAGEIIDRVAVLLKEGHSEVCRDEALTKLVARFNEIEHDIAERKKQTSGLDNSINSIIEKCESSIASVKKRFF
jgi:hypothetical protein